MLRSKFVPGTVLASVVLWLAMGSLAAAQTPAAGSQRAPGGQTVPPTPPGQAAEPPPPPPSSASAKGTESTLVPEGEAERMAAHPVGSIDNVRFRPGHGIQVKSSDDAFELNMKVRFQLRYTLNNDNGKPEQSFRVYRARVEFSGHVFGEHNTFHLQLAMSPHDMNLQTATGPRNTPVYDAYLTFTQLRDANFQVGQYKVPFSRERVMSDSALELVDRSITNGEFNLDRSIGFDVRSKAVAGIDKLRYYAGIYTGQPRDSFALSPFHMMYLARVEVLPLGNFDDYSEADFARTMDPRLSLGFAYAFVDHALQTKGVLGNVPTDGGTTQVHVATADALFKFAGMDAMLIGFVRHGNRNPGGAGAPEPASNGVGVTAQAGYLIPHLPIGVAARYSATRGTGTTTMADRNAIGGGLSWYFAQHPFKLQTDYFHYWNKGGGAQSDEMRVQLQATL